MMVMTIEILQFFLKQKPMLEKEEEEEDDVTMICSFVKSNLDLTFEFQ